MRRRRGAFLAVFVWVLVIWGHSLAAGPESSAESGLVVELVRPLLLAAGVTDPSLQSFIVRKCGHFTEYLVLGILSVRAWRPSFRQLSGELACLAVQVAAVPFIDETIQRFIPGRTSALRDVAIDLAGAATGILIAALAERWHKSRKRQP